MEIQSIKQQSLFLSSTSQINQNQRDIYLFLLNTDPSKELTSKQETLLGNFVRLMLSIVIRRDKVNKEHHVL